MPPPYPSKKTDKDALYAATVAGIAANPGDYPSSLGGMFSTVTLSARITTKTAAVLDRLAKEAAFRVAVQVENDAYTACDNEEQRLLALAEAQYAATAPNKLLEIGWGPRADPTSVVPGQPRVLEAFPQGTSSLTLDWKPPAVAAGVGSVAYYRVERQTKTLAGMVTEDWGAWSTQCIPSEIVLAGLTRGVEYNFRVVAVNAAGDSVASNTVEAVL